MTLGANVQYWYSYGRYPRSIRVDSKVLKTRETGSERGTKEGNSRKDGTLSSYPHKKLEIQAVSEKLLEMKQMKRRNGHGRHTFEPRARTESSLRFPDEERKDSDIEVDEMTRF